ncbi:hypothetical protein BH23BAC1_BH23BAC1_45860 [soil metagenome]
MDLVALIRKSINEYNELINEIDEIIKTESACYSIDDYDYFKKYLEFFEEPDISLFFSFSVYCQLEAKIIQNFHNSIWYWESTLDKESAKNFLKTQYKLLSGTIFSYLNLI